MPIGKEAMFLAGKLLDTPGWRKIPARGTQRVVYAAFLAVAPQSWRSIGDVRSTDTGLVITDGNARETITVAARGIAELQK